MGRITRRPEIQRRRRRRAKIQKLKAKLKKASTSHQVQVLIEKIRVVSPSYPVHEINAPAAARKSAA